MKKILMFVILSLSIVGLVGCSSDASKGKEEQVQKQAVEVNETKNPIIKQNEPFLVKTEYGDYELIIEGARVTDKRNSVTEQTVEKVVYLDYTYINKNFGDDQTDLLIDEYSFQILDDNKNVIDTYPIQEENRPIKEVPVGGKCNASAAYAVKTDSKNLQVTFKRDTGKVFTVNVPIK